jgi:tetratricopeptide (TPR) repeat protein
LPDSIEKKFADLPRDSFFIDKINELSTNFLRTNPGLSRTLAVYATELAPGIKYVKGYAQSLKLIGNSYWTEGAYEFAQNYYLLAARQYQSSGDSLGLGKIYNNIGEVYKKMGDLDKALEYLTQSVQLNRKDISANSLTLYNIGELYLFKNQLSLAEQFIEQALSLSIRANNQKAKAYAYDGLGIIQTKRKKYLQAIDYFERAEKIWKELGEIRLLIQTYQDFSDVYRELRQFEEAERYLILSREMSTLITSACHACKERVQRARTEPIPVLA